VLALNGRVDFYGWKESLALAFFALINLKIGYFRVIKPAGQDLLTLFAATA